MILVLFDFDGTITSKDSFIDFIIFAQGYPKFIMGMLQNIHYLIAYKAGIYPNYKAKEKVLTHFFKGIQVDKFKELAQEYSISQLPNIIKSSAMERIKWHQSQNHKVVIVSASIECWLKRWCQSNNIDLISTKLESIDGKLTGKLATKNCYGIEKVNRIKEQYDLNEFDYIYAYGDSVSDKEMLELSDQSYYKIFQ
jgi:HAD superfamily hydrolase (TIGR01490 family)